jgi:hypothetical protein
MVQSLSRAARDILVAAVSGDCRAAVRPQANSSFRIGQNRVSSQRMKVHFRLTIGYQI